MSAGIGVDFTAAGIEILREFKLGILRIGEFLIGIHFLHVETIDGEGGTRTLAESHSVEVDVSLLATYPNTGDKIRGESHEP